MGQNLPGFATRCQSLIDERKSLNRDLQNKSELYGMPGTAFRTEKINIKPTA